MFGFRYIKVPPTEYIIQVKNGKAVREGAGLAFFYFAPSSTLVRIPIGSVDVPFMFEEVTADFQTVTLQGQMTFRIKDPQKIGQLLNFSLLPNGREYASEDPKKLPQRLVGLAQEQTRALIKTLALREAVASTDPITDTLFGKMKTGSMVTSLGLDILALSILAIRPTPETARALEATAREQILKQADEAIYARRNAAVEQERAIKENELNTEIAVEHKKRQVKEAQMDAEKAVQNKRREIREAEMETQIALEQRNQEWVKLSSANAREQADAKAYGLAAAMQALSQADPKILQALTSVGMDPAQLMATAFRDLAAGAEKIGQLNISPDLLRELMQDQK